MFRVWDLGCSEFRVWVDIGLVDLRCTFAAQSRVWADMCLRIYGERARVRIWG